jgi:hypothetical protein
MVAHDSAQRAGQSCRPGDHGHAVDSACDRCQVVVVEGVHDNVADTIRGGIAQLVCDGGAAALNLLPVNQFHLMRRLSGHHAR